MHSIAIIRDILIFLLIPARQACGTFQLTQPYKMLLYQHQCQTVQSIGCTPELMSLNRAERQKGGALSYFGFYAL